MIKRPVLRYHGGKFKLARWIISHFPPHRVYVEAFGGAGSVLLQKPRSVGEVYNDRWDTVVNIFRVLRDPVLSQQLAEALRLTPYSRTEFNSSGEELLVAIADPVERARLTILRSFGGFGSASTNAQYSTGFRASTRSDGTNVAQDWARYPEHMHQFTERLRGVVIENKDYREVCEQQDGPDTLHFLDPPYVHSTRNMRRGNANYVHEFTDADHAELANTCRQLTGTVIIAGYESELYTQLFGDWSMVRRSALADGGRERVECLWSNKPFINKLF